MEDWEERAARARVRYEDGAARLPEAGDESQRQLTRMGNAAWAAGLSLLMLGRGKEADEWLMAAADTYRESWPDAPAGSWGRPIGAMKSRLIAGDLDGARADARWASRKAPPTPRARSGATQVRSPTSSSATTGPRQRTSRRSGKPRRFPTPSPRRSRRSPFGTRRATSRRSATSWPTSSPGTEYLEDVPVADTVLALQELAAARGIEVALASPVLPER